MKKREYAEQAAREGEPLGLFCLGDCLANGIGGPIETGRALELFQTSADMGVAAAMWSIGNLKFGRDDRRRVYWKGRAAKRSGFGVQNLLEEMQDVFRRNGETGGLCHMVTLYFPYFSSFLLFFFRCLKSEVFSRTTCASQDVSCSASPSLPTLSSVPSAPCGSIRPGATRRARQSWPG